MSFDILPQLAIIVSLMGILLIIGKNLTKVRELESQEEIFLRDVEMQEEKEKFDQLTRRAARRVMDKETYEKTLAGFWFWVEKFLRRTRITFLKLDTKIALLLKNLREKNAEIAEKAEEDGNPVEAGSDEVASGMENKKRDFVSKRHDIRDKAEKFFRRHKSVETSLEVAPTLNNAAVADADVTKTTDEADGDKVRTQKEQGYIDALIQNPRDINAYWKLGILYYRRRNFNDALACFRQIVKIDPDHDRAKEKALELMEKMRSQREKEEMKEA